MSCCLVIVFVIGLSMTLGEFPSRFLKCTFHICIRSSWLAAFSLALKLLSILLTSLLSAKLFEIVYLLLSFLFLTLNLLFLFFSVDISSLCIFFSFCELALVGFLLLHRDGIFTLSRFLLTYSVSHGTLFGFWFGRYAFCCCFPVGVIKVFVLVIRGKYLRYFLKFIEFVSYSYRILIANISIIK